MAKTYKVKVRAAADYKESLVPAIIYGADKEPAAVAIRYNELIKSLETEAFFSHILTINVEGQGTEEVVIKYYNVTQQKTPRYTLTSNVSLWSTMLS